MTDYDVSIQVMHQGNRSGGVNKCLIRLWFILGCCLSLSINQACTYQSPALNTHYLPIKYSFKTIEQQPVSQKADQFTAVLLNDSKELNKLLVEFWKAGAFNKVFVSEHPYLQISREHIEAVAAGLNDLFKVYYLYSNSGLKPGVGVFFKPEHYSNDCLPLSNHEIQFMLNKNAESAFSSITLTMMIISAHELTLQKGGVPIYPEILSPFLRKRYKLPELKGVTEANLFAVKTSGHFTLNKSHGFVFCRKTN